MDKKYLLALVISLLCLVNGIVSSAAPPASSGNKLEETGKSFGRAVMWGPKKIGAGLKSVGEKTKSMFHKK
jgi:hypothetical protein